jgi:hypothetical protein
MTKLTDKELWDALDEATAASELEDSLKKTPEEHVDSLKAAGFDIDKVHADADAFFAKLEASHPAAPSESAPAPASAPNVVALTPRAKRPRPAVTAVVIVALAASVALIVYASRPDPKVTAPAPEVTQAQRVEHVRVGAQVACAQEHWKVCLDRLDEAREMDPNGDGAPDVQALRKLATERLSHSPNP